jgi:CUG-BP- and ETR3-like factor
MEPRVDTTDQSVLNSKLFVGQVPKDMMEENIRPYFEPFGSLREITIIRDPLSGLSRGCAFVIYNERTSAQNAMDALHNILHLPNAANPLQVRFAETPLDRETKLFIGMLPKSFSKNEVTALFGPFGEIKEIHIIRGPEGNPQGCAFVKFVDKEAAAAAIQQLNDTIPNGATRPMVVRYAESKGTIEKIPGRPGTSTDGINKSYGAQQSPPVQHMRPPGYISQPAQHQGRLGHQPLQVMNAYAGVGNGGFGNGTISRSLPPSHQQSPQSQAMSGPAHLRPPEGPTGANLFIYHLPRDITDADLATLFAPFGNVISAKVFVDQKTSDSKGFGFVSYDRHDSANDAIASMNGFQIGSKRLKVEHKRTASAMWPSSQSSGASVGGNSSFHDPSDELSALYLQQTLQSVPQQQRLPLHHQQQQPVMQHMGNRPPMRTADINSLYGASSPLEYLSNPAMHPHHPHQAMLPMQQAQSQASMIPQHHQLHPFPSASAAAYSVHPSAAAPSAAAVNSLYHPGIMMHQGSPNDRF